MIRRDTAIVTHNAKIADGIYLTEFHSPNIAQSVHPGQFVNLSPLADGSILNRPMAIFDVDNDKGTLTIGYHVIGTNTKKYSELAAGEKITLIGPLGSKFKFDLTYNHYFLVGGGIGITSLHLIGKYLVSPGKQITTLIGARTRDLIACKSDFRKFGKVNVATDDGSEGYRGHVHELLDQIIVRANGRSPLPSGLQAIYCGPHLMMKSCAEVCEQHNIAHLAVMEEMMACGVGICVACVCQTSEGQKKVCLDGPVFDGDKVQWTREQTSGMHE